MRTRKKILISIMFFCLFFAFNTLPYFATTAFAVFQDQEIVKANIKIELGNIELGFKERNQSSSETIAIPTDNPIIHTPLPELKNKGSLTGKVYYKIDLLQTRNGIEEKVSVEEITHLSKSLELAIKTKETGIVQITADQLGKFQAFTNDKDEILTLSPDQLLNIELICSAKNISLAENYNVKVTILMMQTNGTLEKPMFHDEIAMNYEVSLEENDDEAESVPPKECNENQKDYWPKNGWIEHGNILYNKEHYDPIMYYSEIRDSKKVKNLNDIILYIYVKDLAGLELKELQIQTPSHIAIETEYVNENKQQIKVTISIDENKFNKKILSDSIDWYSIAYYQDTKRSFELTFNHLPITLKRILLSTDEAGNRAFASRPINLFADERNLFLAQTNEDNTLYLTEPLTEVTLGDNTQVTTLLTGKNSHLLSIAKEENTITHYILKPKTVSEHKISDIDLKILLEGNSGEVLEVSRKIQFLPTINQNNWPQKLNESWAILDYSNNYQQEANILLQQTGNKFIPQNKVNVYIKNPYQEELAFYIDKEENFIIDKLGYSPDGKYMKVDLKFVSFDLKEWNLPTGFNMSVKREKGIDSHNGYISNAWVPTKYVLSKNHSQEKQAQSLTSKENSLFTSSSFVEEQIVQAILNGEKEFVVSYEKLQSQIDVLSVEKHVQAKLLENDINLVVILENNPELKEIKIVIQEQVVSTQ